MNIYPDTALLDDLLNPNSQRTKSLRANVLVGRDTLCVSVVHFLEVLKRDHERKIDRFFSSLHEFEETGSVQWMASPFLLYKREIAHFAGTICRPLDSRAFVNTPGNTLATVEGLASPSSNAAWTVQELRQHYRDDDVGLRDGLKQLNVQLDSYTQKLNFQRSCWKKSGSATETPPFHEFIEGTVTDPGCELPRVAARIAELPPTVYKDRFPALFLIYRLEPQLVKARETYKEGDFRDLLHCVYAPYVDRIYVDKGTMDIVKKTDSIFLDRFRPNSHAIRGQSVAT